MLCQHSTNVVDPLSAEFIGPPVHRSIISCTIRDGTLFLITGKIVHLGDLFAIDFVSGSIFKDVDIRIVASVSTKRLGRNSRINFCWGNLEANTSAQFHLESGKQFEIQVLLADKTSYIAVNGMHVAKYNLRSSADQMNAIEIRGDVTDVNVQNRHARHYPIIEGKKAHISRLCGLYAITANVEDIESESESTDTEEPEFLPVPYYAAFSEGFFAYDYKMMVIGKVNSDPKEIRVALQGSEDVWPQPEVLLQVHLRFTDELFITINSFAHGVWSGAVRSHFNSELRTEGDFNLVIVRARSTYEITLNDHRVFEYPYRRSPKLVKTCVVEGDIQLYDVVMESNEYMAI